MNDFLCPAYWNALWEGCYAKKKKKLYCITAQPLEMPDHTWDWNGPSSQAGPMRAGCGGLRGGSVLHSSPTGMTFTPAVIKDLFHFFKHACVSLAQKGMCPCVRVLVRVCVCVFSMYGSF